MPDLTVICRAYFDDAEFCSTPDDATAMPVKLESSPSVIVAWQIGWQAIVVRAAP